MSPIALPDASPPFASLIAPSGPMPVPAAMLRRPEAGHEPAPAPQGLVVGRAPGWLPCLMSVRVLFDPPHPMLTPELTSMCLVHCSAGHVRG
jgi:hypothetical protein